MKDESRDKFDMDTDGLSKPGEIRLMQMVGKIKNLSDEEMLHITGKLSPPEMCQEDDLDSNMSEEEMARLFKKIFRDTDRCLIAPYSNPGIAATEKDAVQMGAMWERFKTEGVDMNLLLRLIRFSQHLQYKKDVILAMRGRRKR